MYTVLIMSDSHKLEKEIEAIKLRHNITNIIHCGDSELSSDATVLDGLYIVQGNCDFDRNFKQNIITEIGGLRYFITHGHLYDVRTNLLRLAYKGAEVNAQIICYGHTHIAHVEKAGQLLFINPGSIKSPRGYPEKTYVIVEWETKSKLYVNFYDLSGNLIEELSRLITL